MGKAIEVEITVQDETPYVLIYLAGPIANVSRTQALRWRDVVSVCICALKDESIVTFDPAAAFRVTDAGLDNDRLIRGIQAVNNYILTDSSLVLARCIKGVESKGTDLELVLANNYRIPVFLWGSDTCYMREHLLELGWDAKTVDKTPMAEDFFDIMTLLKEHLLSKPPFPNSDRYRAWGHYHWGHSFPARAAGTGPAPMVPGHAWQASGVGTLPAGSAMHIGDPPKDTTDAGLAMHIGDLTEDTTDAG